MEQSLQRLSLLLLPPPPEQMHTAAANDRSSELNDTLIREDKNSEWNTILFFLCIKVFKDVRMTYSQGCLTTKTTSLWQMDF